MDAKLKLGNVFLERRILVWNAKYLLGRSFLLYCQAFTFVVKSWWCKELASLLHDIRTLKP